jgi:HAD superfamily hydrolase (TIGR01509 family)
MRIRGAIWDVDGTLVNSNDAHARAWVSALATFDVRVTFEAVRLLIGMGGDKLLPALVDIDPESERGRAISARRKEVFHTEHLPNIKAFPQARELLERVAGAGIKLAVASSAERAELELLLAIANVEDLFIETSSSSQHSSKPDPDIVQAALGALGLDPAHAIMIGDTPYDIEAAQRAGMRSIALRCGGRSDKDLRGAIAIYDSPADLLHHFDESPFRGDHR